MTFSLYTRCQIDDDLDAATQIRPDTEIDPREVGVGQDELALVWDTIRRLYASGTHPAISLCVRRRGKVLLDRAIGHVSGTLPDDPPDAERVPVSVDTPFCLASASKPVTAMLIHLLDDRGELHVGDPVCEYIPEFGRYGKETITIQHLLTHRAGVPNPPPESLDVDLLRDPDRIVDLLCHQTPSWRPGTRMGYHAVTTGFLFAEIVKRVTGRDLRTYLRDEVCDPLGFRWLNFGVEEEEIPLVARNAFTGAPAVPPISTLLERALGMDALSVSNLLNDPRFLTSLFPSANVVATADEVSRFYELLRRGGELDGHQIFQRRTILRAIAEQSWLEPDFTLILPFRYSMGFMLGAEYMSLYGLHSRHAFGHLGFTNVLAWADPERDLSVALLTSGKPLVYPDMLTLIEAIWRIAAACPRDGSGLGGEKTPELSLARHSA
jgi:CubicO group peptidase (beta-lactamase class C family)